MSDTTNRPTEAGPCAVPIEEQAQNLRDHYERAATALGEWHNQIPKAIDMWEKNRLQNEHPTEAGERERLAGFFGQLECFKGEVCRATTCQQRFPDDSSGWCFLCRHREKFERAANLLRTEPGGEAVARIQVKDKVIQDISKLGPPKWVPPDGEYLIIPVEATTPVEPEPSQGEDNE